LSRSKLYQEGGAHEDLDPDSYSEGWSEVRRRRNKKTVRIEAPIVEPTDYTATASNADRTGKRLPTSAFPGNTRRKAPRNAAISIKSNSDGLSYADIIKRARESVNFKDFGIVNP